jgi:hypothetical protein
MQGTFSLLKIFISVVLLEAKWQFRKLNEKVFVRSTV